MSKKSVSQQQSDNEFSDKEKSPLTFDENRLTRALKFIELQRNQAAELVFEQTDNSPASTTEPCDRIGRIVGAEYHFIYRQPSELMILLNLSSLTPLHKLACTSITTGRISVAADLRYEQIWRFRNLLIGDISSSMALAPGETVTLNIKKTQRTQLTQTTIQSSESLDSIESSIVDKDVLNVARSTNSSQQWHVDGSASFSIPGVFQIGSSGGVTSSVQATSNRSVEQISEATRKSAQRLQTLQKIEVGRQTESLIETAQKRTLSNPYRDRALTLNFFELQKQFSVTTKLSEIVPVIVLEITDLDMDWDFVISNNDFLESNLLDRNLAAELRTALEVVQNPQGPSQLDAARRYARWAFELLFTTPNIFNVGPAYSPPPFPLPDANDPSTSFDATLTDSGLDEAIGSKLGRTFATLSIYYNLHRSLSANEKSQVEIDLAVALAESIKTEWDNAEPDDIEEVMDDDAHSEIMRRVPGFLSIVNNLLTPLLKPLEEEKESRQASRRAEFVIGRVIGHLHCLKSFYVQRYLNYVVEKAGGYPLAETLKRALPQISSLPFSFDHFDFNAGFLDGCQFIVPCRHRFKTSDSLAFFQLFEPHQPQRIPPPFIPGEETTEIIIPTDGVHIEPVAGACILRELPELTSNVSAEIRINAENVIGE